MWLGRVRRVWLGSEESVVEESEVSVVEESEESVVGESEESVFGESEVSVVGESEVSVVGECARNDVPSLYGVGTYSVDNPLSHCLPSLSKRGSAIVGEWPLSLCPDKQRRLFVHGEE